MSNQKPCSECRGHGSIYNRDLMKNLRCEDCLGHGRLQWCERCLEWIEINAFWSEKEDFCKDCQDLIYDKLSNKGINHV